MITKEAKNRAARVKLASYYYAINYELHNRQKQVNIEKKAGFLAAGARAAGGALWNGAKNLGWKALQKGISGAGRLMQGGSRAVQRQAFKQRAAIRKELNAIRKQLNDTALDPKVRETLIARQNTLNKAKNDLGTVVKGTHSVEGYGKSVTNYGDGLGKGVVKGAPKPGAAPGAAPGWRPGWKTQTAGGVGLAGAGYLAGGWGRDAAVTDASADQQNIYDQYAAQNNGYNDYSDAYPGQPRYDNSGNYIG